MIRYYKRDGTLYPKGLAGQKLWYKDFANSRIRRVDKTKLPNGMTVSTVWLGFDNSLGLGPMKLLFESRVYPAENDIESIYVCQYETEAQAVHGHEMLCMTWNK